MGGTTKSACDACSSKSSCSIDPETSDQNLNTERNEQQLKIKNDLAAIKNRIASMQRTVSKTLLQRMKSPPAKGTGDIADRILETIKG